MGSSIDCSDVPVVGMHDLYMPMRYLIAEGRGLALLNGLSEADIRATESRIWADFADQPELRVAIALRFRALLDVFSRRRLKQEFLEQGFKLIARAVAEAASQRLNINYGFKAQHFISALKTQHHSPKRADAAALALAA